jgi:hypothetical protein
MTHPFKLTALAALGLLASVVGASAQSAGSGDLMQRVFGAPMSGGKQSVCFVRTYDAAHLAAHPKQKVRQMILLLGRETHPEATEGEGPMFTFSVGFRLKGEASRLESSGSCSSARETGGDEVSARIGCGVDCDGGGLNLQLSNDSKSLRVEMERIRVYGPGERDSDDDEEAMGREMSGGADDRVFRLDRASLRDCLPLITDKQQIAAIRRMK